MEVLAFIQAERAAGRPFPSKRQICDRMGWKDESSVNDVFSRLVRYGYLKRHDAVRGAASGRPRYTFSLVK